MFEEEGQMILTYKRNCGSTAFHLYESLKDEWTYVTESNSSKTKKNGNWKIQNFISKNRTGNSSVWRRRMKKVLSKNCTVENTCDKDEGIYIYTTSR
jgi:hypothetical protein